MPIIQNYDSDNIFAKILRGEIPNTTVYEDDDVLSFMDLFPQSYGHCLVIPKNVTAVNFLDMPADKLGMLIQRTQMIARAAQQALTPDGIRIAQFNGSAAGQTVFHLHFHVIPIFNNIDEKPHASGQQAEFAQLQATADLIKANIQS